jgi:hypothetical protein
MKMKTMTKRVTRTRQTKVELRRKEEENQWSKMRRKETKKEFRKGEETNLWRWTTQQQKTLLLNRPQ